MGQIRIENFLPVYTGEYQRNKTYKKNNIVTYQNNTWICITEQSIGTPPPSNQWGLLIQGIDNNTIDRLKREIKTEVLRELRDTH